MTELVNPTREQISELPVGSTFIVKGTLTRNERGEREEPYYPGSKNTHTAVFANIAITTAEGDTFEFEGRSFPLQYEDGGALENMRNAVAEVGEGVSIEVHVIVDDHSLMKRTAIGYGKAQLLLPSEERQLQYDALRAQVAGQLDALQTYALMGETSEDFSEARRVFAAIRRLALTKAERNQLRSLIGSLPVVERPIYDSRSTYERDAIEKAFGVNFEEFNAEEYLAFARQVLYGELPNADKPDRVDQSYLFRFLDKSPFTVVQFAELVASTLKIRVSRLEEVNDTHDESWDDYYLVERCIEELGRINESSAIEALGWMIDYCLEHRYFDDRLRRSERRAVPHKFNSALEKAVRSLAEGSEYHDIRVPAGFDFGRMQAWNDTLAAYPFTDYIAAQLRQSFTRLFATR